MKITYQRKNSPYVILQVTSSNSVCYPACIITTPPKRNFVIVNNDYELGKLYFEGNLTYLPQQLPLQYPLQIEMKPRIEKAYYPSVNNYDEISLLLSEGFFKPVSSDLSHALRKHNIQNYKPSANVLKHPSNSGPDIEALELMADEIEVMTEKGIAFKA